MIEQQLSLPLGKIKRICKLEWCDNHVTRYKDVCTKHYQQKRRGGKYKERTIKDPNEIIYEGNICRIILTSPLGVPRSAAIIDREDKERIEKHRWALVRYGYIRNPIVGSLHNYVMNFSPSKEGEIDHKNRDKSDCRKTNLRFCTRSQNVQNVGIGITNKSGFKGVHWHTRNQKWVARIGYENKRISLGSFKDKIEAAKVYNDAALEHHGEFACLNEIPGEY